MRYFMIVAILLYLTGCGGSSDGNRPPASPKTDDIGKAPPALPDI